MDLPQQPSTSPDPESAKPKATGSNPVGRASELTGCSSQSEAPRSGLDHLRCRLRCGHGPMRCGLRRRHAWWATQGNGIEMRNVDRIGAAVGAAVALTLVLAGPAPSVVAADSSGMEMRAAKPQALCANYRHQFFYFRARPANCDFPDRSAQAGSIGSWDVFPTRRVRWSRWRNQSAVGRGRGFMRGVGWRPLLIRLKRSRVVCGRRVFTRMRVRLKAPDGSLGWGRWSPVKTCV